MDITAAWCGCCIEWIGIVPSYLQWVGSALGISPQLTGVGDWCKNFPSLLKGGK